MKTIRSNVFETNSSSTHSIAIPKDCASENYISFHIGEFGWRFDEVDPADYFYTAIYATSNTEAEVEKKIERLKNILDSHNIEYYFGNADTHIYSYMGDYYLILDNGYIDHGRELGDFVDELLNDGDKLVRFLSRGLVFTGNDNSYAIDQCFIERFTEYLDYYDWSTNTTYSIKNPYYMENHNDYDWYWKGN